MYDVSYRSLLYSTQFLPETSVFAVGINVYCPAVVSPSLPGGKLGNSVYDPSFARDNKGGVHRFRVSKRCTGHDKGTCLLTREHGHIRDGEDGGLELRWDRFGLGGKEGDIFWRQRRARHEGVHEGVAHEGEGAWEIAPGDADRALGLLRESAWEPEFHRRDLQFINCLIATDRLALID